jgi:DNA-binding beta-propeller fold protein YncE
MKYCWILLAWSAMVSAQNFAYVVDSSNAVVYVVELLPAPDYGAVVGSIDILDFGASDPGFLAFTPDGTYAYVSNFGSADLTILKCTSPNPSFVANLSIGNQPKQITFTPSGQSAFACNQGDNTVSVLDTSNPASPSEIHRIDVTPDGGLVPEGICTNQSGSQILVSCSINGGPLLFYNASSPWNHLATLTPGLPSYIATNSNRTTAYVTDVGDASVIFIDMASQTQTGSFSNAMFSSNDTAAINPQNTVGAIYNPTGQTLYVFDALTGAEIGSTSVGPGNSLNGVAFSPDGSLIYVTNNFNSGIDVYSASNPFPLLGSISGFPYLQQLTSITIQPTPTPIPPNDALQAAILASAQTAAQQNINLVESAIQEIQNQTLQVGILNITNGTYADTVSPAIIDATTQFTNLIPIIPVWCGN